MARSETVGARRWGNRVLACILALQVLTPASILFLMISADWQPPWDSGLLIKRLWACWPVVYFGGVAATVMLAVARKANVFLGVITIVCAVVLGSPLRAYDIGVFVISHGTEIAREVSRKPWAHVAPDGREVDMRGKPFPWEEMHKLMRQGQLDAARELVDVAVAAMPSEGRDNARLLVHVLESQAHIYDALGDQKTALRINRRRVALAARDDLTEINAYNQFKSVTENAAAYCEAHGRASEARELRAQLRSTRLPLELQPPPPKPGRLPAKPGELSPWPDSTVSR